MIVKSRHAPRQKKTRSTGGRMPVKLSRSTSLCDIQSPDGTHECGLPEGHPQKHHQAYSTVVQWVQLTAADAKRAGVEVGEWVTIDVLPRGEQHVVVAYWPRRDDDISPSGVITSRNAKWMRRRATDDDYVYPETTFTASLAHSSV